jgi:hypothetical protein
VGTATLAQQRCWCPFLVRWRVNARAMVCAGKRARRVKVTARLGVGHNRGVAAGDTAEPGPAPWVATSMASAVGTRACVRGPAGGKACTWWSRERHSPSLRPRARLTRPRSGRGRAARPILGGESRHKRKGPKVQPCPPGWRARVLGCTMAREHRARMVTRANASANANSARRRERERHVATHDGEKGRLSKNASVRRRRQRHLQTI